MRNKIVSAAQAAALVKDGDALTTSGFVGIGVPDELLAAIETRFLETELPRDLSLIFAAGQGDGKDRGLNRLGHEGLPKRVVGGHWGLIPKVAKLATCRLFHAGIHAEHSGRRRRREPRKSDQTGPCSRQANARGLI